MIKGSMKNFKEYFSVVGENVIIVLLFCYPSGPERKSAVITQKNKELVAYHEGGHALVALYTPGK